MKTIKAPVESCNFFTPAIFLAGSIEQGKNNNWRKTIENNLKPFNGTIFNPQADDWDPTWNENHPKFIHQVNWELSHIEMASMVAMYFQPKTLSPITLLELGILTGTNTDILVCCPPGFWQRGNVKIVCERFNIPFLDSFDQFCNQLTKYVKKKDEIKRFNLEWR